MRDNHGDFLRGQRPPLIRASKCHRHLHASRIQELDIRANRLNQSRCEELYLLAWLEMLDAAENRQELALVVFYSPGLAQLLQLPERVVSNRRPETKIDVLQVVPIGFALLSFLLKAPLLHHAYEMVGGEPYRICFGRPLPPKKLLAALQPSQGVFLAIERWKLQFVKSRGLVSSVLHRLLDALRYREQAVTHLLLLQDDQVASQVVLDDGT